MTDGWAKKNPRPDDNFAPGLRAGEIVVMTPEEARAFAAKRDAEEAEYMADEKAGRG